VSTKLTLKVLEEEFAVTRLDPGEEIPIWAMNSHFFSLTRTEDELSIVCQSSDVPEGATSEQGFTVLKVLGPLDFSLTGIIASLTAPLAEAEISIFTISTYDTDYLLVKRTQLEEAELMLRNAGFEVVA